MTTATATLQAINPCVQREYFKARTEAWPKSVRVLGLGHVLMGDDGFGPAVIESFRSRYECGRDVEVLDLGTPGLDLSPYLYGVDLVILADCVAADEKAGRLRVYREADVSNGGAELRLNSHDPGLHGCLAQLKLVGHAPSELLIVGVIPESCELGQAMSATVDGVVTTAADTIACLLEDHGVQCLRRPAPLSPALWWLQAPRQQIQTGEADWPLSPDGRR